MISTVQNGGIVTEGLLFYFDAINSRSYLGTTSSWYDISPNQNNCSINNSPVTTSYVSTYGGGFNFPSSSNYQSPTLAIPYTLPGTSSFAVDLWYSVTSQNSKYIRGILSCGEGFDQPASGSTYQQGWVISWSGVNTGSVIVVSDLNPTTNVANRVSIYGPELLANKPYHLFLHRNTDTQVIEFYVNGVRYGSVPYLKTRDLTTQSRNIGSRSWSAGQATAPLGIFHAIKVYQNKNFTAAEVQQNYVALKGRFGL